MRFALSGIRCSAAVLALAGCGKPAAHVADGAPTPSTGTQNASPEGAVPRDSGTERESSAAAPSGTAASPGISSASTTAVLPDRTFVIRGVDGFARHEHGGPPAELGWFKVHVENRGPRERTLSVRTLTFLSGHSCDTAPSEVRATLHAAGLLPDDGSLEESAPSLRVAPGASLDVTIGFRPRVTAYYTFCDRFAFRADFSVDDAPLTVLSETRVTRVEPFRKRP